MDNFMGLAGLRFPRARSSAGSAGRCRRISTTPGPRRTRARWRKGSRRWPARSPSSARLPPELPKAICSSSSTEWITSHLAHLGLEGAFGDMIFSGGSMSPAASRRPTSISTPPTRSACRSTASRSSRIRRSASKARSRRARGDRPGRRPPLPARPRRAAAGARRPPYRPRFRRGRGDLSPSALELVAAAVALGVEIGLVVRVGADLQRHRSTTSIPSASSAVDLPADCW